VTRSAPRKCAAHARQPRPGSEALQRDAPYAQRNRAGAPGAQRGALQLRRPPLQAAAEDDKVAPLRLQGGVRCTMLRHRVGSVIGQACAALRDAISAR